jgi:hypothetical protein
MPARPSHLPQNVERSALQKLRATQGLASAQLHPAGKGTIAKMVEKGWIESQLDARAGTRYCITPAGEAALKAKIPADR